MIKRHRRKHNVLIPYHHCSLCYGSELAEYEWEDEYGYTNKEWKERWDKLLEK